MPTAMRGQNFTCISPAGNANKTKTKKHHKPARHLASERYGAVKKINL
jgi:hypothetical protein